MQPRFLRYSGAVRDRSERAHALLASLLLLACGGEEPERPRGAADPTPVTEPVETPHTDPTTASEPPPAPPPSVLERRGPYLADVGRDCDGFPHLALTTLPGLCVGIVLHGEHEVIRSTPGRFRPRAILQDPAREGVMWLVDAGARRSRAGRLWRLIEREGAWTPEVVVDRLDRPHGIRLGPDGWIYVGEVQRIVRLDPRAEDPASTVERVIGDLPTAMPGREIRFHPLKSFVFTPEWHVVLNMGSATDRCLESLPEDRCHDEVEHTAALWRFRYLGERRWSDTPEHIAHGLRNSVALAAHPSGTILQGENGSDFREVDRPHEELNVIEDGRHYGWPYCYDRTDRDPEWAHSSFSCDPRANATYAPPRVLLPSHGAPLGMLYYEGERMPELRGKLLIALHGYRDPGHRVLLFDVDARGIPAEDARYRELIAGWEPSERGPRGSPVEMTVARDGSLWIIEDTNGTVLRLSRDAWAASRVAGSATSAAEELVADATFVQLHRDVLLPRCSACHDHLSGDATSALRGMQRQGWLTIEDGRARMWDRVRPGAERSMPPNGMPASDRAAIQRWLDARQASSTAGTPTNSP